MNNNDCSRPWVVRANYHSEHQPTWEHLKQVIVAPQHDPLSGMDFTANVAFVEDKLFADQTSTNLVRVLPDGYQGFFVFVVDEVTMISEQHPLLVIGFSPQGDNSQDFDRRPSQTPEGEIRSFRAIPSTVQSIENNLSIANMDFEDFAQSVDPDGIFRGFSS
ncbi:MAG: hypothetical protein RLY14_981 [Planctomycetota bacterium]|jgi:hypothetical protein